MTLTTNSHLFTIVATILVSTSFPVGASITHDMDSLVLTLLRFAVAALLFAPLVHVKYGLALPSMSDFLRYGLISAFSVYHASGQDWRSTMTTKWRLEQRPRRLIYGGMFALALTALTLTALPAEAQQREVGVSPWGPADEIGRLNLITPVSRDKILSRIDGSVVYDLSVEYFIGMPSWQAAGDPHYRIWMTHTPQGTVIDNPLEVSQEMNEHVSYSGAAISMYTHMGTHIDALNHFGLNGKIWNGFSAQEHLGDRGWAVTGAEKIPLIIARGVLIDVAAAKGLDMLGDGYRVTRNDLVDALHKQRVDLQLGDVVLIRTGRMQVYEDAAAYMANPPGLGMAAARFLVEEKGAMIVGADNLSFEAFPSELEDDYVPLHTYLLAQHGTPILELVNLEELSKDAVYEFAFIGGSLKLRGSDAAPIRPIAIPVR